VVNFKPRPLYPQERTPISILQEARWSPEPVRTYRSKENKSPLLGYPTTTAQWVPSLVTVPTEISRLLSVFDLMTAFNIGFIILVIDQLNAQILFYNKFIIFLYMFRGLLCSSSGGQIVLYSIWYHHTCRWPSGAQAERGLCARDGHLQV